MAAARAAAATAAVAAVLLAMAAAVVPVAAQQAAVDLSAITAWTSTDGGPALGANDAVAMVPRTVVNGVVQDMFELLPALDDSGRRVRVRSSDGSVLAGYPDGNGVDQIGDCTSPTAVARSGKGGPEMVVLCAGTGKMVVISSAGNLISVAVPPPGEEFNRGQFISALDKKAAPLVYPGAGAEEESVVVALYASGGGSWCVGGFLPSSDSQQPVFSTCSTTEITDFYFSRPRDTSPEHVFLLVEMGRSPQPTQMQLLAYDLSTFTGEDTSPFAKKTWGAVLDLAQTQTPIVRSNVNDAASSTPLIAYAQAVSGSVVGAVVRVFNPKVGPMSSDMQRQVTTGDMPVVGGLLQVTDVLFISYSNVARILVQTTAGAFAAPHDSTSNSALTAPWKFPGTMVPGVVLLPLRDIAAQSSESHRHQYSPSHAAYNPYHLIAATGAVFAVTQSSELQSYSFASMTASPAKARMDFLPQCGTGDRLAALTTFTSQTAYIGCQSLGAYGLVNVAQTTALYTMLFPSVAVSGAPATAPQPMALGFAGSGSRVVLHSARFSSGVPITPLPNVMKMAGQVPFTPAGEYYNGYAYVVTVDSTNVVLYRYKAPASGDGTGVWTAEGSSVVAPLSQEVPRVAFLALFGVSKRYIGVAALSGLVHVFDRQTGAAMPSSPYSLSQGDCGGSGATSELMDFHTEMYDTRSTENYAGFGSTRQCVFRIDHTLKVSTWRREMYSTGSERVSSTSRFCIVEVPQEKVISAYSGIFQDGQSPPQTFTGYDLAVVGTNVIITLGKTSKKLSCMGLLTSTESWSVSLTTLTGPAVSMRYYNNSLYLVDSVAFYQFDVAQDAVKRQLTRTTFTNDASAGPILAATVDKGMVVAVSAKRLYVFDALLWRRIFEAPLRQSVAGGSIEILVHTATTAGQSPTASSGQFLFEVRTTVPETDQTPQRRVGALYRADDGTLVAGVDGRSSILAGPTAAAGAYVVFEAKDSTNALGGFRSLGLPSDVNAPPQTQRKVLPTVDVEVPGEVIPNPTPEPLPRGDVHMAGSPPMDFFIRAGSVIVSDNTQMVAYGNETLVNGKYTYAYRCVPVSNPGAASTCNIPAPPESSSPIAPSIQLLQVNQQHFAVLTGSYIQFYSWGTGASTGSQIPLGGRSRGLPPYVVAANDDLFVFLNGNVITAVKPSSSAQSQWSKPAPNCRSLRLVAGSYLICDVGSFYVLSYPSGQVLVDSTSAALQISGAVVTRLGSGSYVAVSLSKGVYNLTVISSSGALIRATTLASIPSDAGEVRAITSGWSTDPDAVVVLFETVTAYVTGATGASPVVSWVTSLRGMEGQVGGLAYVSSGSNLVVGTDSGLVMMDKSGAIFSNISMRRTYAEDAGEVQPLRQVALGKADQYALSWNGHVVMVTSPAGSAQAVFSYGSGATRVTCLGVSSGKLYFNDGAGGGIASATSEYWGANLNMAVAAVDASRTDYVVGWDQSNSSDIGINLGATSWVSGKASMNVKGEVGIVGSSRATRWGVFFGTKTITFMGSEVGSGSAPLALSSECGTPLTFRNAFSDASDGGKTLVWYSGPARDCLYTYFNSAPSPRYLGSLNGKYVAAAIVPYAGAYATLTATALTVYDGATDAAMDPLRVTNAVYMSVVSSPSTRRGIFVVVQQAAGGGYGVSAVQTDNLIEAWATTVSAASTAPVTYYNTSIYVSTETGVVRMTLEELSYPCPPRNMFTISRPATGRSEFHSQVAINTFYSIGYVTSRRVFYAFDAATGAVLWERADLDAVREVLVLQSGKVVAASSLKFGVVMLNAFTGATLLTIPTQTDTFSRMALSADGKTLTVANMMTTSVSLDKYQSYFSPVVATRPEAGPTPDYAAYSYQPSVSPPSCEAPPQNKTGEELYFSTPPQWVSASNYGYSSPRTTGFFQRKSDARGVAVTLKGNEVLAALTLKGSYQVVLQRTLESASCTNGFFGGNAGLRQPPGFVGVSCGSSTAFYQVNSNADPRTASVVVLPGSVLTNSKGTDIFFVNGDSKFDALSLETFQRPSGMSPSIGCTGNAFTLLLAEKLSRVVMSCSGTGLVSVNLGSYKAAGVLASPSGAKDFSTVEVDEDLNIGVACRVGAVSGQSTMEMVVFSVDGMTQLRPALSQRSTTGTCGIRYVGGTAYVVAAYDNGAVSYSAKSLDASPVQTSYTGQPCGITTTGVLSGSGTKLSFTAYGASAAKAVVERARSSMGYCASLYTPKDGRATANVAVFASNYLAGVDTSASGNMLLWMGTDNSLTVPKGSPMLPADKYLYVAASTGNLAALSVQSVAFAVSSTVTDMRLTVSLIKGDPYVFFSQMGSLACVDPTGKILWNHQLMEDAGATVPFAPIAVDGSDYLIASSGQQSLAYVNKITGETLRVTSFPTSGCTVSSAPSTSTSFTNGTTAFIALGGWSCVHVLGLTISKGSGETYNIPPIGVVEYSGNGGKPLASGFPIHAQVGAKDLFVLGYQSPSAASNVTFAVFRGGSAAPLWGSSLRATAGTISTYGYFLYTGDGSTLSVYDLLTGRYVWGFYFDEPIAAPVIGYDPFLFVVTLRRIYQLDRQLNTPTFSRNITNTTLPKPQQSIPSPALTPLTTRYRLILYSTPLYTTAFVVSKGNLSTVWTTDRYIYSANPFIDQTKSLYLVATNNGDGVLDLSTGVVSTFGSSASNSDMSGSDSNGFTCSFFANLGTCRVLPPDMITPAFNIPVSPIPEEPTETTPENWVPWYPDGSGGSNVNTLEPTPECLQKLRVAYPSFMSCLNQEIRNLYPLGRGSALQCPTGVAIGACYSRFADVASACLDVMAALNTFFTAENLNAESPLGLCNRDEASVRCSNNTNTSFSIQRTCTNVQLETYYPNRVNFRLPAGYKLGYVLAPLTFAPKKSSANVGAIVGGVIAGVVVVAIVTVLVLFYVRRQRKERDMRFFDEPLNDEDGEKKDPSLEEPMLSVNRTPSVSSKASSEMSMMKDRATERSAAGTESAVSAAAPAAMPAKKAPPPPMREGEAPRKMPPKQPGKGPAKGAPKAKAPAPAAAAPAEIAITDDDDI